MAIVTNPAGTGGSGPDAAKSEYAALVRAASTGDRAAMERLLMRAQEVAFRFSLLACGHAEDAEDVMQDALLKTYQHVSRIADPDAFRTWLYTTVRNACLMKRRRRAGEPVRFESIEQGSPAGGAEASPIDVADQAPRADQRMIDDWADARLRQALAKLPPAYRIIMSPPGASLRSTGVTASPVPGAPLPQRKVGGSVFNHVHDCCGLFRIGARNLWPGRQARR